MGFSSTCWISFSLPQQENLDIIDVQKNTLTYMSLMKHVIPVLFTDSKYWLDECKNYKVHCITDFEYIHFKKESMNLKTRMNSFKLPFFFGLFRSAIKHFPNVPFYGYINGDILVEQSITDVLFHVEEQIQTAALVNKVLSSRTQS